MNISEKAKKNFFILWLLVVPLGTFLVYQYAPGVPIVWDQYIWLLLLAVLTSTFPFFIAGTTMVLVLWVNLAIFLKFGIFAELISMQVCMIPIVYHMKINKGTLYKFYFNSFMMFLLSVICGYLVIFSGFKIGSLETKEVLLYGTLYAISYILLNHIILYIKDVATGLPTPFFTKDFYWEIVCIFVTLPFGLSLYLFENSIGNAALWLLGIPLVMITLLIRMYSDSEKMNIDLNKASEFGHELAEQMTSDQIMDMFIERVSKMFPLDSAYIVDNLYGKFVILRAIEEGHNKVLHSNHEDIENSLVGSCYKKGIPTLYNKQSEWIHLMPPFLTLNTQSVMCVPIYRNQKIEGVLVLASRNRHSFEAYQLKIIHLLCSYFAVSVEKAKYVREAIAKSERCELTKIYNYRYLHKQLENDVEKLSLGKFHTVSLVILDIDHFKSVNDTYGHHSGNIILQEFAQLINSEIGRNGTVARYGGEEFVIILPNYSKLEALNIAEQLRRKIEQTPFMVQLDLDDVSREEIVFITASIGVSSAPDDSEDGVSLLRNADRALYIGAKREGRNRVAEYVK